MEDTDIGARVGLRWRRGPFELMNVTGIPIALHAATTLGKDDERYITGAPWTRNHDVT